MIKMIQKLKNKKGFTLVELIVVIAIIAILTAVIVPLIARYSAQARYTTLMDAAQTISNSANNAMSDANQQGVVTVTNFSGSKTGNTLTIKSSADTTGITTGKESDGSYSKDANKRAEQKLWEALSTTLPDGCNFYVQVKSSAVEGVIYTTEQGLTVSASTTIVKLTDFDNAYATAATNGKAIGVSGCFLKEQTGSGSGGDGGSGDGGSGS